MHSLATSFNSWYSSNRQALTVLGKFLLGEQLEKIEECLKHLNTTRWEVDKVMELGYLNEEFKEMLGECLKKTHLGNCFQKVEGGLPQNLYYK